LLDQDFGGDKSIVLFSQFLDQFLVLIHLFEVIDTHDVDPKLLCSVNIVGIAEDADGHLGSGDVGQFDLAGETLVSEDISHLQQKETGSVGEQDAARWRLGITAGGHSSSSRFAARLFR
jgi:hypothetical protein